MSIEIYTDGSCSPNDGTGDGGWGVVCIRKNITFLENGFSHTTTNNKMEMYAFYKALDFIPFENNVSVIIYSDSKYVINEIGEDIKNGVITGWLHNQLLTNKDIKNRELWIKISNKIKQNKLSFKIKWVKGHNTNKGNILADKLANDGRKRF